jgi:hypothetical protein
MVGKFLMLIRDDRVIRTNAINPILKTATLFFMVVFSAIIGLPFSSK